METSIFCPDCRRFIGLNTKCIHCQWTRAADSPAAPGSILWHTRLGDDADDLPGSTVFPTQITAGAGMVFSPTDNGSVVALDAAYGRRLWSRPVQSDRMLRVQSALLWGDLLLLGPQNLAELPTFNRSLLAWQAATGEEAWNWPTTADNLSIPLVVGSTAYFATSDPELVALDLDTLHPCWRAPAPTWSPEPPALSADVLVLPSRGPQVSGYHAGSGRLMWSFSADDRENETLHHRPAVSERAAYLAGWGRRLYAVDLEEGRLLWRYTARRGITAPPVAAGSLVLAAVKDIRKVDNENRPSYTLVALDGETGKEVWKFPLDRHLYTLPLAVDDTVFAAGDDGCLHALDLATGAERWQVRFNEKLRGSPCIIDDRLVVGQRDGVLACVQWKDAAPARQDPQALLAAGRPLDAARELALDGEYEAAARLYEKEGELENAAALYLEAGMLREAADLYARANELEKALVLRREAGDRTAEAEILHRLGKHSEAAVVYEQAGSLDQAVAEYEKAGRGGYAAMLLWKEGRLKEAAELFHRSGLEDQAAEVLVEAGEYADAAETYLRLGKDEVAAGVLAQGGLLEQAAQINERLGRLSLAAQQYAEAGAAAQALVLYEKLEDWQRVAELAEQTGDLLYAAGLLARLGRLERSAELYLAAGEREKALEQFAELGMWEKAAGLAGELALWEQQANALSQLGLMVQAGETYEKAAEDLLAKDPKAVEKAAALYEQAVRCYQEDDDRSHLEACTRKVCQLRRWPLLKGSFSLEGQFVQEAYSVIRLVVQNDGYCPAQNIRASAANQKFRIDENESQTFIRVLGVGQDRSLRLLLQPQPDVLGQVLLRITLSYEDTAGETHQTTVEQIVRVLDKDLADTPWRIEADRITPSDPKVNEEIVRLIRGLDEYFNDDELQDLCYVYLQVEYENLRGETKASRARDLVFLMRRHGRLAELKETLQQVRPHATW